MPGIHNTLAARTSGGGDVNGDYVFLCGVMKCAYGQREASKELLRATRCLDPDIRTLAWALLARGISELKNASVSSKEHFEDGQVDKTMPAM
jgi:hypothetical protein